MPLVTVRRWGRPYVSRDAPLSMPPQNKHAWAHSRTGHIPNGLCIPCASSSFSPLPRQFLLLLLLLCVASVCCFFVLLLCVASANCFYVLLLCVVVLLVASVCCLCALLFACCCRALLPCVASVCCFCVLLLCVSSASCFFSALMMTMTGYRHKPEGCHFLRLAGRAIHAAAHIRKHA